MLAQSQNLVRGTSPGAALGGPAVVRCVVDGRIEVDICAAWDQEEPRLPTDGDLLFNPFVQEKAEAEIYFESVWSRAERDAFGVLQDLRYWLAAFCLSATCGLLAWFLKSSAWFGGACGILVASGLVVAVLAFCAVRAPFNQRDDARMALFRLPRLIR